MSAETEATKDKDLPLEDEKINRVVLSFLEALQTLGLKAKTSLATNGISLAFDITISAEVRAGLLKKGRRKEAIRKKRKSKS